MQADRLVGLVGLKPGNGPPGGDRPTAKVLGRRFELATGGSRVADASARNNPLQGLPDRTCLGVRGHASTSSFSSLRWAQAASKVSNTLPPYSPEPRRSAWASAPNPPVVTTMIRVTNDCRRASGP